MNLQVKSEIVYQTCDHGVFLSFIEVHEKKLHMKEKFSHKCPSHKFLDMYSLWLKCPREIVTLWNCPQHVSHTPMARLPCKNVP